MLTGILSALLSLLAGLSICTLLRISARGHRLRELLRRGLHVLRRLLRIRSSLRLIQNRLRLLHLLLRRTLAAVHLAHRLVGHLLQLCRRLRVAARGLLQQILRLLNLLRIHPHLLQLAGDLLLRLRIVRHLLKLPGQLFHVVGGLGFLVVVHLVEVVNHFRQFLRRGRELSIGNVFSSLIHRRFIVWIAGEVRKHFLIGLGAHIIFILVSLLFDRLFHILQRR